MTASFFSSVRPSGKVVDEKSAGTSMVIHTMEDDLKDIRQGKDGLPETAYQKAKKVESLKEVVQKTANPFSEEGREIMKSHPSVSTDQSESPFGVAPQPKSSFVSGGPEEPSLKNGLSGIVPNGEVMISEPKKSHKLLLISIILATILIIGGALYFYLQKNSVLEIVEPVPTDSLSALPEFQENPSQSLPYSLDKPNYLSFNTEKVSLDDIRDTLSQTATRIKDANIAQPVEFLVTDQNNNSLAFSRFAFLLKLDINSELLSLVSETFSLYVYNDAGASRLGLVLTLKNASTATPVISKIESTLPYAFQALILEPETVVTKNISFRSSTYNTPLSGEQEFAIRFANVNIDKNVSFDYAIQDARWIIGTSKNTLRAILDMNVK